ncbi:hypothetical protein KAR91_18205 [Candidatus Pacearchaeota archaeon]|nr:hypothetical protein [Candidatus Pacearchaeota archaeon]
MTLPFTLFDAPFNPSMADFNVLINQLNTLFPNVSIVGDEAVSGNLAVTGTTALTGNATAAGTLIVTGLTTLNGGLAGGASADIALNTDKFTVDATQGNTLVAGTFDVTDAAAFAGGAVFNESSADVDFRVESNGNASAFFVDGGNDRIGIFTAAPTVALDVTGDTLVTGALAVTANLTVDGTIVFNDAAADKDFTVNKATSGAAILYDAGADTLALNSTLTTHTGALTVEGAVIFNEAGADLDFRIESSGNTDAIFVDAGNDRVGIMTAAPTVPLDVTGAIKGSTSIVAGTTLASGTTVTAGSYFLNSVGDALTAVGTDRSDALQLAAGVNNVTTAAASTGVVLPVGVVGMQVIIEHAGANAVQVYGSASETIDSVAGATGVVLTNAKRCMYLFVAANTWISMQMGVVSA